LNNHIRIRICKLACVNSYHWRLDTTRLVSRVVGEPSAESRVVGAPLNDHIRIRMCKLACVNSYHWRLDTPSLTWVILLPCCERDPANNVSLNIVCNIHLYQSIWSLVRNRRGRVGLRHVCTPLCVVIMTGHFARSGEIIQRAAKV
jgi:hypothetical protein